MVALLRGINVGGHRKVPMAVLRQAAEEIGFDAPRTYVASGNLVFGSGTYCASAEARLEHELEQRFGFRIDVVARTAEQWSGYCRSNPFPAESARAANLVMLVIGKQPADDAGLAALRARATGEERVERRGDAMWIWFANGAGRSKLGLTAGRGVWTSRNWRTVTALRDML
jgi:uncharacterized protein (DUF1697 family)